MKGRSLYGGGKPCGCGVDLRRGTKYSKVSQSAFISKEKFERWETGLDGQDARGSAHETVGHPPLDRSIGDGASIPVCAPVDEPRLGDREAYAQPGPYALEPGILLLQDLDVAPIRRRGYGHTEVVHVGEGDTREISQ